MSDINFCHLHVHDQHSLLDGFGDEKQYVKRAKDLGQKALALTNHGNIDGLIKFQKECKKNDIIPILGCEAYMVKDANIKQKGDDRGHVTLIAKNQKGFENLCKMLTWANLNGFYYRPRIDYDLLYENCEGLIVLTACAESFIAKEGGAELLYDLNGKIPGDVYLEVMPHIFDKQREINKLCIYYSEQWNIPLISTNDCHYVNKEDAQTHEVLLAMQTKAKWTDRDRFKFTIQGFHLRSIQEMKDEFLVQDVLNRNQIDKAIALTGEVAEKCKDFFIKKQGIYLPKVPGFEAVDIEKNIIEKCLNSFKEKFGVDISREFWYEFNNLQNTK